MPPELDPVTPAVLDEIDAFLAAWPHVTLATVGADGAPQAAVIGVAVAPGRELVFDTLTATRKYGNLVARPRVALTIGWDDFRTLQYEGDAELLVPETPVHEALLERYLARFPDGYKRLAWVGIAHFRVRPRWLRYSDYRDGVRVVELDAAALGQSGV